jgi:RimJ/RimL family protein N-acetyltransferase
MDHYITQSGFGLRLRPLRVDDAEFILKLRCNPKLNRFINETSPDIEVQKNWTRGYFQRKDDYYFCMELEKNGAPVGAVAIYNILDDLSKAEWGRWIVAPGVKAAPASAYLIYQIALEQMGLSLLYCRVVADNLPVVSFHASMGAERVGILKNDAFIRGEHKDHVLFQVDRKRWKTIKPKAFEIASKTARFLD